MTWSACSRPRRRRRPAPQRDRILRGVKVSFVALRKLVDSDPLTKEIVGDELMSGLRIVKPTHDPQAEVADALP
jgi:hypothetical protein